MKYLKNLRVIGTLALLAVSGRLLAAAPANNNFAQAQVVPSATSWTVEGTTFGATGEPGDPAPPAHLRTVWYSWTAPSSGIAKISAVSTDDPLAAYVVTGNNLLLAHTIASRVVTAAPLQFYAVAGQTYRICIDDYVPGYISYDGFAFTLSLGYGTSIPSDAVFVEPLSNDNFANPFVIPSAGGKAVFYTQGSTFEPFEQDMINELNEQPNININYNRNGAGGVWASWQAPASGTATLTAQTPKNAGVLLIAGTGDTLSSYVPLNLGANGMAFSCQSGVTYRLYFLTQNGSLTIQDGDQMLVDLSLQTEPPPPPPPPPKLNFADQAGTFCSLVGDDGFLSLTLAKTGAFTGKLMLSGANYALKGAFDDEGKFNGTAGQSPVPLSLNLDPTANASVPGNILMTGSAAGKGVNAYHAAYEKGASLGSPGKYTVLLEPTQSGDTIPQGAGIGHLTVSKKGGAKVVGVLGDGTAFSTGSAVTGNGDGGERSMVFSNVVYKKRGTVAGTMDYSMTEASDCTSAVKWTKPQQNKGGYYTAGFTTEVAVKGQRYIKPVRSMALFLPGGTDNASISLNGGGLQFPIIETVTLTDRNEVKISGANAAKLKMIVKAASGDVKGSFIHPLTNKPVKFKAILFQNPNVPGARGYFLGPLDGGAGLSGSFSLAP